MHSGAAQALAAFTPQHRSADEQLKRSQPLRCLVFAVVQMSTQGADVRPPLHVRAMAGLPTVGVRIMSGFSRDRDAAAIPVLVSSHVGKSGARYAFLKCTHLHPRYKGTK